MTNTTNTLRFTRIGNGEYDAQVVVGDAKYRFTIERGRVHHLMPGEWHLFGTVTRPDPESDGRITTIANTYRTLLKDAKAAAQDILAEQVLDPEVQELLNRFALPATAEMVAAVQGCLETWESADITGEHIEEMLSLG